MADGKSIKIPSGGLSTFGASIADGIGWCKEATLAALKAGYRPLDCFWACDVDLDIGQAIREFGIPRSEIFITTKFCLIIC
ncbi:hypothetical protein IFR04_003652 [Cadophora malorum]|uniref:Uncharacterized protein n=1 Tax=Cadophora malorum TaxID=108018 RepID=A0A8H7WE58_9HELO|nr:hypothetical protein IFR04_003652 [Cadophora malorum]